MSEQTMADYLARIDQLSTYKVDYGDGAGPVVVTLDEFIRAERDAGFNRTVPGYGPATAGFSAGSVSGWVTLPDPLPRPVGADVEEHTP